MTPCPYTQAIQAIKLATADIDSQGLPETYRTNDKLTRDNIAEFIRLCGRVLDRYEEDLEQTITETNPYNP